MILEKKLDRDKDEEIVLMIQFKNMIINNRK